MAFESAMFRPAQGSFDAEAVRAHLGALPHAFLDPVEGKKYHLSGSAAEAQHNRRARLADPRRFPYGVLVEVRPDGVLIDQAPMPDALAQARAFVGWLLSQGAWRAETEYGDQGLVTELQRLYPDALPDPDSLVDDPLISPPPHGVLWTWREGDDEVWLHDSGAWRVIRAGQPRSGKLSEDALARWLSATDGLDPDEIDGDADDASQTASLSRESPEEEASVYYDRRRPPEAIAPALTQLASLRDGGT
jgi:hypothetical protein